MLLYGQTQAPPSLNTSKGLQPPFVQYLYTYLFNNSQLKVSVVTGNYCTVQQCETSSMVQQQWCFATMLLAGWNLSCRALQDFYWQMTQFQTLGSNWVSSIIPYFITPSSIWYLSTSQTNAARSGTREIKKYFLQLHSAGDFRLSQHGLVAQHGSAS